MDVAGAFGEGMGMHVGTRMMGVALILGAVAAQAFDGAALGPQALTGTGDLCRVWQVMDRAQRGEKVTVAVIGGSITAGAKASQPGLRYGNLVADWWRKAFPAAEVVFVNAGVGATGSNFGALRASRDLLAHAPDFVVVEYGVNDGNTQAAAETLEGLLRQILEQPKRPAVVQLFMMHQGGGNAQEWHGKVGRHYGLPIVSFRDALWPEIQAGRLAWETVMADGVHPNDLGHACAAAYVGHLLDVARAARPARQPPPPPLPAPLLSDLYASTALFEAPQLTPLSNSGWTLDTTLKAWRSDQPGSMIVFELDGTALFAMHQVIKRAMGKVRVQIDDGPPAVLDGWFNQTWGGYRNTVLLAKDLKPGRHAVRIELLAEKNPGSDGHLFNLYGLGAAGVGAQPSSVAEVLGAPVLEQAGLSSYAAVFRQVSAADEAADTAWSALASEDTLTAHQQRLRTRWLASFGGLPARTPLNARTTGVVPRDGYRIEKILFESQPGLFVTAHLFLPDAAAFKPPYPAVLIPCGHSNDGKASRDYQRGAVLAAKAGLAAFIYDPIDQGERLQRPGAKPPGNVHGHNIAGVSAMLLGWNTARFRIWDGMRALDYVQSRPEIDARRLGVMGNSGGGTLSAYLMALDDRIGAGAPSCYITTLRDVCDRCGPQDAEQNFFGQLAFGLNHAGCVLARAPSPVCLNCAHDDFFPFAGSQKTFAAARAVFERFGWGGRLAMIDVPGAHGWKEGTRTGSIQWMRRWLADDETALPLDVEYLRALCAAYDAKAADCGLQGAEAWVTAGGQVRDLPGARSVHDLMRDELAVVETRRSPLTDDAARAQAVRRVAGIRERAALSAVRAEVARFVRPGITVIRQTFTRPSGLALPTVTLVPDNAAAAPVLVVADGGKSNAVAVVEAYLQAGHPVMAADLTAVGEIGACKHRFYGAKNDDEGVAVMLDLLGRSLVGLRAEDILICAQAHAEAFGGRPVVLCATGDLAIAASHAVAAEAGLFAKLDLRDKPLSWSEVIRSGGRFSFSNCVQDALRAYDWPELAAP
jgi:lysophospholipase L1-like esterase/dienelactone hydrolase